MLEAVRSLNLFIMIKLARLGSCVAVAMGAAFAPSMINAQILDVGGGVNGTVNVGQVATSSVNVDVGATTSIQDPADTPTTTDVGVTATSAATATIPTGLTEESESIVIDRSEIDQNEIFFVDEASVTTSAELDTYARSLIQSDPNIVRVSLDNENVSLWYRDRARLLGFIPVTVSARASIDSDGTVDVSYPWYSFLTIRNSVGLESDLNMTAGSIARAEGGVVLSAPAQARVLNAARSVMQAHYQASLETDIDTTGDIEIE